MKLDTEAGIFDCENAVTALSSFLYREEVKEQLEKKKKGSRALAEFEEKMNEVGNVVSMLMSQLSYLVCCFSSLIINSTEYP